MYFLTNVCVLLQVEALFQVTFMKPLYDVFTLLGCYRALFGSWLLTFWDNLSVFLIV